LIIAEIESLQQLSELWGEVFMIVVGLTMIYLAVGRRYEPLLLLPIGSGIILANIPFSGVSAEGGFLLQLKKIGLDTQLFPLLMFLGLGALTDFSALIQRPYMALLGAAAQLGIFGALLGAVLLDFSLAEAGAIAIIGGADGPTAIFVSTKLAPPELWGPIAVSAYSYMAMVPLIQPPIIRLLTTKKERRVKMEYEEAPVARLHLLLFHLLVILSTAVLAPKAVPLIGMLMFGSLLRTSGVVDRLAASAQNEIINIVTILLGLSVGGTMIAERFLDWRTLSVFALGLAAFAGATAGGVVFGKVMYLVTRGRINPLLGAAGVSAVPMAARVVHRMGLEADPENYLLMHAMGPNAAGVLGSAVAAGVLLNFLG
jgi:sodium ion-translocating decarboxylase beta subunit